MMIDTLLITIGFILLLLGLLGAFVPILPGPPLSFAGMLLIHFSSMVHINAYWIWVFGLLSVAITLLDYLLPIWGTRKSGGTKHGVWGATIGLVAGILFFPPLGIILGPFAGAWLAEIVNGQNFQIAFRSALGSLIGLLVGTLLKFALSIAMFWHIFKALVFPAT